MASFNLVPFGIPPYISDYSRVMFRDVANKDDMEIVFFHPVWIHETVKATTVSKPLARKIWKSLLNSGYVQQQKLAA